MFESMHLGISVVFPLLCYMIVGGFIKKAGWVTERTLTEINKVTFRVFMAALVFLNSYSVALEEAFTNENIKILALSIISVLLSVLAAGIICRRAVSKKERRAILIQGVYRSNLALFGIPVSLAIYGDSNQGTMALALAFVVPIYNIIAEFLLSNASGQKITVMKMLQRVLTNPMVTSSLLGLFFAICKITIPELLLTPLTNISKIATPLAFIVLGGSLVLDNLKADWRGIALVSFFRLVVIPGVVFGIALSMGIRGQGIVALLGIFASPVAVSAYTMAKDNELCADLAGELVAVTTLLSIITIFSWIVFLNYFSYI